MRKNLLPWTAVLGLAATLSFSSCTYDPYYTSVGGSYSSGYGYGYGYGGSGFSTSLFVSTGDPRWGYDPYSYCYYDYRTRRYYDPYLYGYYPIGYRPPIVYGVPHPYGWRPGHGYCPPPRAVRNVTVVNYRDRESAYRSSKHSWAKQVRQKPYGDHHGEREHFDHRSGRGSFTRNEEGGPQSSWYRGDHNRSGNTRVETSPPQGRLPSGYNTPVIRPEPATRESRGGTSRFGGRQLDPREPAARTESTRRFSRGEGRAQPSREPSFRNPSPQPQPNIQRPEPQPRPEPTPRPERDESRGGGLRSLGEG